MVAPGKPLARTVSAPPALAVSQGVAPDDAPVEPVLDIHDIQGNSLVGFNQDFQAFLFFKITDAPMAKQWLRRITPRIATVAETLEWRRLFRAVRARTNSEPTGMVATWVNVAFSNNGIRRLRSQHELDQFTDAPFKDGMERRARGLGDPTAPGIGGKPLGWKVGAGETYPDILAIVASDSEQVLEAEVSKLLDEIAQLQGASPLKPNDKGLLLIFKQRGADLGGALKGHEHFGFKDGIAQPGIRGRIADDPQAFLTPRLIDPSEPSAKTHSRPGQPLLWPGQFVLGERYPRQNDHDRIQPGPLVDPQPPWARNGSFLVFRRLRQDVAGFWRYMHDESQRLAALPGFAAMNAIRLASLLVGRWPSGAPLIRAPLADDPVIAGNDIAINNFNFAGNTVSINLRPGATPDVFPSITDDSAGLRCPFAGHVRKVNPRDQNTDDLGPDERTLLRRMLRRGIPYGVPVKDPLKADAEDRGLLFVSYQTSIEEQFEFVTRRWTNNAENPKSYSSNVGKVNAGHDAVMGQAGGMRERTFTLTLEDGTFETLRIPGEFVTTTGGGYFFAPSISALRDVLSA
jgi:Dyp-type peroxidase family